ncbi:MAG TPA: carboxypeptidase-like regulatory domain-containing protein, partial [Cyclobacteriaceae bacterium]
MIKSFFISFAAFVSLIAGAQDSITLSGKVVDAETNEPLTYASVTLKGKPVGTITNADGEFEFYVPENYMRDTLVISYVGYHYYCERVLSIKDHKKVVIKLKFKPMVLNEVVVVATKVAPQEIVKKAFEKVENNYPVNAHRLKGFYREIHEENEKTVLLVEAALDIYDQGYRRNGNKSTENEKVHLLDGRASKSYRNSAFNNTTREKWNLVVSALRHNPVKYPDPNVRKKGNTFMLDSIVYYNDRLIYVISFFTYISRFPNFERKNILYIDSENYAIYKYGWEEYAKKGD